MSILKWTRATAVVLALGLLGGGALAVEPAEKPAVPPGSDKAAEVVLRWKFEKDKTFYQEITVETVQTLKVMNNDVRQNQKQTFFIGWTPLEQKGDDWVLREQILGVRVDIDLGGQKISYDSTRADAPNSPLSDFFKALVGADFRVTVDKDGQVEKIEGTEPFIKKVAGALPAASPLLTRILTEEALRRQAEDYLAGPRGDAVRPGDSWTRKSKMDMGPLGQYQTTSRYAYEGKEGRLDRVKVKTTLKYHPPTGDESLAQFKVKNAEMKRAEGDGFFLYDPDAGRIVRLETNLNLEGTLTVSIGDQDTKADVSQTQKTTIKTTDVNPIPPVKPADDSKEVERLRDENERLKRENERLKRRLQAVEDALRGDGKSKD